MGGERRDSGGGGGGGGGKSQVQPNNTAIGLTSQTRKQGIVFFDVLEKHYETMHDAKKCVASLEGR